MSTDDGDITPAEGDPGFQDDEGLSPVDEAVTAYNFRVSGGEEVDLPSFLADYPVELRDEIEQLCRSGRSIQKAMEESGDDLGNALSGTPERIGPYTLGRLLGRGGMAEVYLATEDDTGLQVALKVLQLAPDESGRAEERFRREALTAGRLEHPGIASVRSILEHEGLLAIAMDYIPGHSLARILREEAARRHRGAGAVTDDVDGSEAPDIDAAGAAVMIASVAEALQHAHDQQVIHRDIKPSNIMIDEDGQPHVLDFGLAKDVREVSISRLGDLAGTPAYMSPEQAMAKRVRVDHRTDIFSLGVVLYEALTLRRPFEGDSVDEVLYEINFARPAPVVGFNSEVPADLETICLKALEKNPDDRYGSAGAFALDLRRFVAHRSIEARRPTWLTLTQRRLLTHRWAAALVLLTVVLVGAAVPFAGWWSHREQVARIMDRADGVIAAELSDGAPQELVAELEFFQRMEAEFSELPMEQAERLSAAIERLRTFGRSEYESGVAEVEAAFGTAAGPTPYESMSGFADGYRRLVTAALLAPDNDALRLLASEDVWLPRLTVTSDQPGDRVLLQRLEPVHHVLQGAPVPLGSTPLIDVPVEPGLYRVLVVRDGFGYGEFTRRIEVPRFPTRLDVVIRPTEDVGQNMVTMASAQFIVGSGSEDVDPIYYERKVTLPAFQIDEAEVSNAQYREFVLATGYPEPWAWGGQYEAWMDDLPVVTVTVGDAQAYAGWAGKRLPTSWEWGRASRGLDGNLYPVDTELLPLESYVIDKPVIYSTADPEVSVLDQLRADYRRGVQPVRSLAEGRTPEGLFHTFGNAVEWVGNAAADMLPDGRIVVRIQQWIARGSGWTSRANGVTLAEPQVVPGAANMQDIAIGFRCARTVIP